MDILRQRILQRLDEKRLTMSEASARMGRNTSYLQQFLKRGIPAELGERDRLRLAEVLDMTEDDLRGASAPLPVRNYRTGKQNAPSQMSVSNGADNFLEGRSASGIMGNSDLPVYGSTGNNDGTFTLTKQPVGRTARPDILAKTVGAYAVIIDDDSMEPHIEVGATVFIDPHAPPSSGKFCVLKKHDSDVAMVRRFVSRTKTSYVVHRNSPKGDETLRRSEWPVCQLAVGLLFPR